MIYQTSGGGGTAFGAPDTASSIIPPIAAPAFPARFLPSAFILDVDG